jgi:hypothetical protein
MNIAELKARLAKAESERDTWRAAGNQENYLEAYSMVEALALQLEQLERATRPPAAPEAEAVNYAELDRSRAFADPGADDAAPLERLPRPSAAERERMRTLGIAYADGVFHWGEYCYDRLVDAIACARR